MPSGRVLRNRSFALICLVYRGSCAVLQVASSAGENVLFISKSWSVSHSVSMVHISSILISTHNCPMVTSPSTEGKYQPFVAALGMTLWTVIVSHYPRQYPPMCPTVWTGRFSSVTVSPFDSRIRLQMSHIYTYIYI
jgi:hypothetical protein